MAPKKAPKKAAEGDVDLFEEFKKCFKKMEQEFETPKIPNVVDILRRMEEEEVKAWCFDTDFDPMAFRVLFQALHQVKYVDIEALRIWKCNGGDESVRSVCYFLDMEPAPNVKDLQFCDNGLTELGCEFLARTLGPNGNRNINFLRLDYNLFGSLGVEKLSSGLSQNSTLRYLSLQYCNIGAEGGLHLSHALMFHRNAVEILKLRGNYLGNQGVVDLLSGVRRTKTLVELDLYDNKFSDSEDVIKSLCDVFANVVCLTKYDLSGNQISDAGGQKLVQGMIGRGHLDKVFISEQVSTKTWEQLEEVTAGAKKKGGKKKK